MGEVDWAEKRNAVRQRTLKHGRIVVKGMSTMDCLIRNMSLTGARVALPNALALPDEFDLLIGDEGLRRSCEVMSRNETSAGVRFFTPLTPRELGAEFMGGGKSGAQGRRPREAAGSPRAPVAPPPLADAQTPSAAAPAPGADELPKIRPRPLPTPIRRALPW